MVALALPGRTGRAPRPPRGLNGITGQGSTLGPGEKGGPKGLYTNLFADPLSLVHIPKTQTSRLGRGLRSTEIHSLTAIARSDSEEWVWLEYTHMGILGQE